MSATMGELEAMDNATLRAKCLEFGLPNVPITDTSRKVLIKKLILTMSGGDADKSQTKQRRETIHVTKIPTPVENNPTETVENEVDAAAKIPPSRASSRRTMAAPASVANLNVNENNEFSEKRTRQKAATPDITPKKVQAPLTARRQSVAGDKVANIRAQAEKRKTIVIEENDEDDIILVEAAENAEQIRPKAIPRSRDSRSVSLTKTGVVTTSYNREIRPSMPSTIDETESDDGIAESYAKSYDNARSNFESKDHTNLPALGREISQNTFSMRNRANKPSAEPDLYKNTLTSRYSTMGTYSQSQNNYMSPASHRYTINPVSSYIYNENSDGQDEDDILKPEKTPFLSSFARTLERMKEEPLSTQDSGNRNLPLRYSSRVMGRRPSKESITESFWNLFQALNHKYDLGTKLTVFAAVVVVTFIYFFFIR